MTDDELLACARRHVGELLTGAEIGLRIRSLLRRIVEGTARPEGQSDHDFRRHVRQLAAANMHEIKVLT